MIKKKLKQGFTLMEIVIVIAVIGILSAVIIPSFSAMIDKGNLNSDKELIDQLNLTLSSYEKLYGKPNSVEAAMVVVADDGYTKKWVAKSENCTIYWYSISNQFVLAKTVKVNKDKTYEFVIYPEEFEQNPIKEGNINTTHYDSSIFKNNRQYFKYYDQDRIEAEAMDLLIPYNSGSTVYPTDFTTYYSSLLNKFTTITNSDEIYQKISGVLGLGENRVKGQAVTRLPETGNSYSSLAICYYGLTSEESAKPKAIFLTQTIADNATDLEKQEAYEGAGKLLYAIFAQMENGTISKDVKIFILPQETVTYTKNDNITTVSYKENSDSSMIFDLRGYEWQPVTDFTGYFGSADSANPAVIRNLEVSSATKTKTVPSYKDAEYMYYVTGVFNSVNGNACIENISFSSLTIDQPAIDVDIQRNLGLSSRNTIGIVGAVTSGNVAISNISVDANSKLTSASCVGGIVGYVGSLSDNLAFGSLNISSCDVSAKLVSNDYLSTKTFSGMVGGIVGYIDKCSDSFIVSLDKCSFKGSASGYKYIGGLVGFVGYGTLNLVTGNKLDNASLDAKHSALKIAQIGIVKHDTGKVLIGYTGDENDATVSAYSMLSSRTKNVLKIYKKNEQGNDTTTVDSTYDYYMQSDWSSIIGNTESQGSAYKANETNAQNYINIEVNKPSIASCFTKNGSDSLILYDDNGSYKISGSYEVRTKTPTLKEDEKFYVYNNNVENSSDVATSYNQLTEITTNVVYGFIPKYYIEYVAPANAPE